MHKKYIIQHLNGGDYDYSLYDSPEAAWEGEKSLPWVSEYERIDQAKKEFLESLRVYSHDEMMTAYESGESWPEMLGFIGDIINEVVSDV